MVALLEKMSAAPQLRGLLTASTKKHAAICFVCATTTVLAFKFLVHDRRVKRYEDFYKYVLDVLLCC